MSLLDEMNQKATAQGIPLSAHIDITWRCNERCVHCYLDHEGKNEMSTDEIKDVIRQLEDAGTFFLSISGGEPLLRRDCFEILEYARALRFKNDFFDAVVCFHVLGNMLAGDRKQAAVEAQRVLKNGGKLFFKEFGCGDFRFGKGTQVESASFKRRTGIVTHYFAGRSEIEELFGGLELLDSASERWTVRYAGEALQREEIRAVFIKSRRSV